MALLIDTTRIGNEPTLRYTPGGDAVIKLSLPFEYGKRDPETKRRSTQWVDATLWGKRAEGLAPYLLKGQWVHVEVTDVHIEEYEVQGSTRSKLAGRISDIKLVGDAPKDSAPREERAAPTAQRQTTKPAALPEYDDFDESIPF